MNFEFIEFYPFSDEMKKKRKERRDIGTVHIYVIDCELDIRGVIVNFNKGKVFFRFPHFISIESGVIVKYPFIRFANDKYHNELLEFLHKKVKPEIEKRLKENVTKTERPSGAQGKERAALQTNNQRVLDRQPDSTCLQYPGGT